MLLSEFKRRFDKEWEKGNAGLDAERYKELQQELRVSGKERQDIIKKQKIATDPKELYDLHYKGIYNGNKYYAPRQNLRETSIRSADSKRKRGMNSNSYNKMVLGGELRGNKDIHKQIQYPDQRDHIRNKRLQEIKKKNFTGEPIKMEAFIEQDNRRTLKPTSSSKLSSRSNIKKGLGQINEKRKSSYTPTTNTSTTQTVSNATSTSSTSIPKTEPKVTANTYAPSGNDVKKTAQAVGKRKYNKTLMEYWNNLSKGKKAAVALGTVGTLGALGYGGYKLMSNRRQQENRK
jgi:hypothetical protein